MSDTASSLAEIFAQARTVRKQGHPVEPLLVSRWSPRALSGGSISDSEVLRLFEAARWAPSSYNEQEWRFVYAKRDTASWATLFDLLVPGNQIWCERAALLCVIVAKRVFTKNGSPNPVHLFDCGTAFENLALQGTSMGLVVHGMQGFDYDKARTALGVPEQFAVVAMFAVGRPGDKSELPPAMQQGETPSQRKPLNEIISEGTFQFTS